MNTLPIMHQSTVTSNPHASLVAALRSGAVMTTALLLCASLVAQTWTGGGGDNNWATMTNWSTGAIPSASDNAILGAAATVPISMNTNQSLKRITFDATAVNGITIKLSTAWRINAPTAPGASDPGGIAVLAGNSFDNVLDLNGRNITLGASGMTNAHELAFTNNGSGVLQITNVTGSGSLPMTSTGAAGGSLDLVFNGTGRTVVDVAIVKSSGTNPATFNISQTGSGVTTFNRANTYNGTTSVSAGKLWVNGTHTDGAAYTIAGGLLGGSGTITTAGNAGVTIGTGGKLSAGSSENAIGTLTFNLGTGSLDLSAAVAGDSASLLFRLGATDASDRIVLQADSILNLGTGVFGFSDFVFSTDEGFGAGVYTLFETSTSIVGSLSDGQLSGTLGGFEAILSLANDNKSLLLTVAAIPEPATTAILLGGLGCLLVAALRSHRRTSV
ncbi:PEP-CTERM sorting domain-containing protein [Geminisphaera colitermitum]|uniref:PEP-CTERM sorting domain-containing protein n=1 Tax=Geminisphaera colitermitum TaxID=1148786 RepID=UPI00030FB112|nr:PEP-CTERM sorting domain-containing protein [Geminisphaera colitermitum]